MYDAMKDLRKPVLKNKHIHESVRQQLALSLLSTRLLYNICVWPLLGKTLLHRMMAAHLAPLRVISRTFLSRESPYHTNHDLMQIFRVPDFLVLSRTKRLRYLTRLLRHAPYDLLLTLDAERKWIESVVDDCKWLRVTLGFNEAPCPETDFQWWLHSATHAPGWRRWIRDAQ